MSKTLVFTPSKGFPPFTCLCGNVLKKEQESYWLIAVENHPTQTRHVRLNSDNPEEVCSVCQEPLPVFCESEQEAQTTCDDLNKHELIDASVFCLDGD